MMTHPLSLCSPTWTNLYSQGCSMTARSSLFRTLSSARPTTRTLITLSAPATTQRTRPSTINATAIRFRSESSSSWTESFFGSSKQKYAPGEFAKDPIITYDELLPITEQPSDVSLLLPAPSRCSIWVITNARRCLADNAARTFC